MRTLTVCLVLFPALALADSGSAQKLESARKNLAAAVDKIKQDAPSNSDLDAAKDAVEALKVAIDGGADLEQSDLDYAKAALAARKELRTGRDYVEERRAKIKIFDAHRTIDAALKTMAETGSRTAMKEPSPKDFDDARAAADVVKKLLDESRSFGAKDPQFASYVSSTDAAIAKHLKAVDDRQVLLAVEKQRAVLTQARDALKSAMGSIQKGSTDDQFHAGDAASKELSKRLEEGKSLESKNTGYAGDAAKARAELDQAKKKMDATWSEVGLAKLKAEIDPAFKDLQAAARPVKSGKANPDQLAEARTAAIVVRKLVEKFAPEAERSQAFGVYIDSVKKQLAEVETAIEQRSLGAAQKDVVTAQRAVEKASATDDQFGELNSAINVLEKTLGTVHKDEPMMAGAVKEAEATLRDAKAMASKRRGEVDADKEKKTLTVAQKDVVAAQRAVEKASVTDDQFSELASALNVLEKTLGTVHKDNPLMAAAVKDAEATLRDGKAMAGKRHTEVDSDKEKKQLLTAQRDVENARRAVEKKDPLPTDDQFAEFNAAINVLDKTLGSVHKDEPLMAASVKDASWALREAKQVTEKRRLEVDVEKQKRKVEDARKILADAMIAMQKADFGQEQITASENATKLVITQLDGGKGLTEKDKNYAFYDGEVRKRLKEVDDKIAARKVVLTANQTKSGMLDALAALKAKVNTAKQPDSKDADVDGAIKAAEALQKSLEEKAPLEKQNAAYAAQADKVRWALPELGDQLELAKFQRELRKKTGDALAEGITTADGAAGVKDLRNRKSQYEKALGTFKSCQTDGNMMLTNYPVLVKTVVLVEGANKTPREVMALCGTRAEAAEQAMKDVLPLIKFEDGPKKSYEAGKGLLSKDKGAALKQFNECIATGKILQHDNPELNDKSFEVAGSSMTLTELVQQCQGQKKALAGK
jgi:hypothetical protein